MTETKVHKLLVSDFSGVQWPGARCNPSARLRRHQVTRDWSEVTCRRCLERCPDAERNERKVK